MLTFSPWTNATPTTGWHNASADREGGYLRHFNGEAWSVPVHEDASDAELDRLQSVVDPVPPAVVWWRSLSPEFVAWLDAEAVRPLLPCAA